MEEVVQIRVNGRVQGVGFRAFTRAEAQRLGLAGWVRNQPDGSVEVVVHLPPAQREAFLAALKQGPPGSQVTDLHTAPAPEGTAVPPGTFRVKW